MSGFRWPRTFARSVLDSKMFNKNLRRWLSKLFERMSNLSKDYFFSQCYGENLQRYSSVRVELHVRACLRTFEKFLSSDTFLLICPSLFTSLKEIFCRCSLILTRRITRPACLHVFTLTRDAERGCREQRILVVRYKITESKQIVWKETGVFRTMLPIFFAPGETFGSVELRRHGSRPSTVGFVLVLRRTIKSSDRDELLSLHPKEENSQFS